MTEAEWLAGADPLQMLRSLRGKASERRQRLFAVACCRDVWGFLVDARSRRAVETAESLADDPVDALTFMAASEEAHCAFDAVDRPPGTDRRGDRKTIRAAHLAHLATQTFLVEPHPHNDTADYVLGTLRDFDYDADEPAGLPRTRRMAGWLLCIFGNPFRPITLVPRWRTADAVAIAGQMYDSRDFGPMPILADALMDAGCTEEQVIAHCRGDGPHVRGCWVVDLILSKDR